MGYKPLQPPSIRSSRMTSSGPTSGENKESYQQFLNESEAIEIVNFWLRGQGRIEKTEGYTKLADITGGSNPQWMDYFGGHLILVVNNVLKSVLISSGAVTTHRTYSDGSEFHGFTYGDFYYLANGLEEITYLTFDLGSELITTADWAANTFESNTNTVSTWQYASATIVSPGPSFFQSTISQDIGAVAGTRYQLQYSWVDNTYLASSSYQEDPTFGGCFSTTNVVTGSGTKTHRVQAISTDDFSFDVKLFVSNGNKSTVTAQVPVGTIDGANTTFTVGASGPITDNVIVKIDGATVGSNTLTASFSATDEYTLECSVAPTTTLTIDYRYIDNEIGLISPSVKEINEDALTYGTLTGSPYAAAVYAKGGRMYTGNIAGIGGQITYSEIEDGTAEIPFYGSYRWDQGTDPDEGGTIISRLIGDIKDIDTLGDQIVFFATKGRLGLRLGLSEGLTTSDAPVKSETIDFEQVDFGSERGVTQTPYGIAYANESGFYLQQAGQDTNVAYSSMSSEISLSLGEFDLDTTNGDIMYYPERDCILFSCKDGSDRIVKVYHFKLKAWSTIDYPIAKFATDQDGNFYGLSEDGLKAWTIFIGTAAEGADITCSYKQEINATPLGSRGELLAQDYQSTMGVTTATVTFDKYNEDGTLTNNALVQTFSQNRAGGRGKISNFERMLMTLSETGDVQFDMHWLGLDIRTKEKSRNRKVVDTTP